MDKYDFTYKLPDNFQQGFVRFLNQNGMNYLVQPLLKSKIVYKDIGYAYYAGMKGDVWDKIALDFTIESGESTSQVFKNNARPIKEWLERFISPITTGFLVRRLDFLIRDEEIEIALPENNGDDFETLSLLFDKENTKSKISRKKPLKI